MGCAGLLLVEKDSEIMRGHMAKYYCTNAEITSKLIFFRVLGPSPRLTSKLYVVAGAAAHPKLLYKRIAY